MSEIAKTQIEIQRMLNRIEAEMNALPDRDLFGDSTEDQKDESLKMIIQLKLALDGILTDDTNGEVYWWLIGRDSFLDDCYGD